MNHSKFRVDIDMTIKVSDFGLCRQIYENDYYRLKQMSRVPVKWMAMESLHDGTYTHQSDVVCTNISIHGLFS